MAAGSRHGSRHAQSRMAHGGRLPARESLCAIKNGAWRPAPGTGVAMLHSEALAMRNSQSRLARHSRWPTTDRGDHHARAFEPAIGLKSLQRITDLGPGSSPGCGIEISEHLMQGAE